MAGRPSRSAGRCQDTLPECRKVTGHPPGVPEGVGTPSQWSGTGRETLMEVRTGQETLPEVQKWSGDPPGGPEVVGRLSRRFGTGREAPLVSPDLVGRPSRRSESSRETLSKVGKWSGDPPGGPEVVINPPGRPEVVGRPSRRNESGRETCPEVWKWSGDPHGGPEVVGRAYRRSGRGQGTLP